MTKNKLPDKVLINPNVVAQDVDDEIVLLHMETEQYFSLDDVGTELWKLLIEKDTVQDVLQAMLALYNVDETRLRNDLEKLISRLVEAKLISIQDN